MNMFKIVMPAALPRHPRFQSELAALAIHSGDPRRLLIRSRLRVMLSASTAQAAVATRRDLGADFHLLDSGNDEKNCLITHPGGPHRWDCAERVAKTAPVAWGVLGADLYNFPFCPIPRGQRRTHWGSVTGV